MKRSVTMPLFLGAALAACLAGTWASAQSAPSAAGLPLLDQAAEVRMALSAAPEYLRARAGVYVLGKDGFKKVRESDNGFNCLVDRGVNVTAPVCYDEEGSATLLQARLKYGELMQHGGKEDEVNRLIDEDVRTGRLRSPRKAGVAYMLSAEFVAKDEKTGAKHTVYPPHVMIYAPYLKNADIGVPADHVRSHSEFWVAHEGEPNAYIIVPAMMMGGVK